VEADRFVVERAHAGDVAAVPQGDGVDDKAESPELLLLTRRLWKTSRASCGGPSWRLSWGQDPSDLDTAFGQQSR